MIVLMTFQVDSPGTVLISTLLDILALDILGLDISGLAILGRFLEYVIFMSRNLCPLRRVILYCNVGWCVKGSAVRHCRQQCLVAEWLGLEPGNGVLPFFFSVCYKHLAC